MGKRGGIGKQELELIRVSELTNEELAMQLGRSVSAIINVRKKMALKDKTAEIIQDVDEETTQLLVLLRSKPIYERFKQQYSAREMEVVEYHWVHLAKQFQTDMTHTEELQIFKLIHLEITLDRITTDKNRADKELRVLEEQHEEEMDKGLAIRDVAKVEMLIEQINGIRAAQDVRSRAYHEALDRFTKMLKDLKATRDQRVQEISSTTQNFFSWLKLLSLPEYRHRVSMDAELIRLAANLEEERLAKYHKFMDDTIDQPFLTPNTVQEDNK